MAGTPKTPQHAAPEPPHTAPRLDRGQITNLLTVVIVVAWIITAVVRIFVSWPEAAILDAAMPVVVSWWFASSAMTKKNGGNGAPA